MPKTAAPMPTDAEILPSSLIEAIAAHEQMSEQMTATQALIERENAQLERIETQLDPARKARNAVYERLMNAPYEDGKGYAGEWPSYRAQQDFIRAHPDMTAADARIEELEQEQAEIEARKQGLIRVWHEQERDRAALHRHASNLDHIRELVSQRRALEEEADTIAALLEEKQKVLSAAPPMEDFPERRAALLASVALGEAGAKEALAALDKDIAASAAAHAKQASIRADTAQLVAGLKAKLSAKQADWQQARERERLAVVWHLQNEMDAEQARHHDAERELHHAHLRLAALYSLTGQDRNYPYPWLNLPNHQDTWDTRADFRERELNRLDELGLDRTTL